MLSLRVFVGKIPILLFLFSCILVGSCGFHVVSPDFRKRKSQQIPLEVNLSAFSSPLFQKDRDHVFFPSSIAPRDLERCFIRPLNVHRQPFDEIELFKSSRSSPLFRQLDSSDEFRLRAASNHDDDSSISTRIRSFISKIYKRLSSPVNRLIRWIRSKFTKMDEFLEETIEEQEKAVEKAIADMEAKASEIQSKKDKNDEPTTTDDEKEPMAKVNGAPYEAAPSTTIETSQESTDANVQPESVDGDHTDSTDDSVQVTLEEAETSGDAQVIATAETTEEIQSNDAALASEKSMLSQLDEPTAKPKPLSSGMEEIVAQEQKATSEAQTEIVEKVEDVQTMDAVLATEEGMLAQLDKSEAADADVMSGMQPSQEQKSTPRSKPAGDRWAIAAPNVDLSGDWSLIITEEFKKDYDDYLKKLGQPFIVRSVALTLIGVTTEHTEQNEEGRTLFIRGTNARGIWERTLVTSGADKMNDQFTPLHVPVDTADDERVEAEAWWEDEGTVHRSWMRGIGKYGGGDFESKRYLEEDGKVLVTESTFHPNEQDRNDVKVIWRFLKDGETLDS